MEIPKQVERYGKQVWETTAMDILRREHCMCLHCDVQECKIAEHMFKLSEQHGIARIVTRCPNWEAVTK